MKVQFEIDVPDGIDITHAYDSIMDALYLPDNVTQQEYDLVEKFLSIIYLKLNQ